MRKVELEENEILESSLLLLKEIYGNFSIDKVHISEYSDRNAGVQPDTFAMRFSRV